MCTGAPHPAQRGWTLLALVLLLFVGLVVIIGMGIAVSEGLRLALSRLNQTKAFYLAHAGVMDAIACYRSNTAGNWFGLGCFGNDPNDLTCDNVPNLNLGLGEVFIRPLTSPQRDFVLVNMAPATVGSVGGTSRLTGWQLRNVRTIGPGVSSLTITKMLVDWTQAVPPNPAERVTAVIFDNDIPSCSADWFGSQGAGQEINIPDCALSSNTLVTPNRIDFNTAAIAARTPLTITLTFIMSDADDPGECAPGPAEANPLFEQCRRTVRFAKGGPNTGVFTIRSIGETRASPMSTARKLRAEYRATASSGPANRIIGWIDE